MYVCNKACFSLIKRYCECFLPSLEAHFQGNNFTNSYATGVDPYMYFALTRGHSFEGSKAG